MMIYETEYLLERHCAHTCDNFLLYVKSYAGNAADHRIYREHRWLCGSDGICRRAYESVLAVLQASGRKSGGQAEQIQSVSYRGIVYDSSMRRIYICTERGCSGAVPDHQRHRVFLLLCVHGYLDVEYAPEREDRFRDGILRDNERSGHGSGSCGWHQRVSAVRIPGRFLYRSRVFHRNHHRYTVYKR